LAAYSCAIKVKTRELKKRIHITYIQQLFNSNFTAGLDSSTAAVTET